MKYYVAVTWYGIHLYPDNFLYYITIPRGSIQKKLTKIYIRRFFSNTYYDIPVKLRGRPCNLTVLKDYYKGCAVYEVSMDS